MGQGSYVICEMDSVQKEYPSFQAQMAKLERDLLAKCALDWGSVSQPKAFGKLTPKAGEFGRTTILPGLFHDQNLADLATWRQLFIAAGNQVLLQGNGAGNTLPEDFKVGCMGFAFPNKEQNITEIKMQIGDRKYGRINLEEMRGYNKPAVIFEEGFTIEEEQSFELYGYVEGPIPVAHDGYIGIHQRIVPIGFCCYRIIDKVLGNCGATII